MQLEIKPLDTVFFRDGKPFSMGEESWADGIFPPNPSVFAGVLRTIYMTANKVTSSEVLKETMGLRISGATIKKKRILFPFPGDVVSIEDEKNKLELKPLILDNVPGFSNYELPKLLSNNSNKKVKDLSGKAFISINELKHYLETGLIRKQTGLSEIIKSESKVGIGRDKNTHIVKESMLYRVNMLRLEDDLKTGDRHRPEDDVKFIVEYDHLLKLPESGICNIGAEGKKAYYEIKNDAPFEAIEIPPEMENNYVKLYLATPSIFLKGWMPNWVSEGTFHVDLEKKISIKLIACSIGKPINIGGFDMANRVPKPMYRAVPAGSTYYFKTESIADANLFAKTIHNQKISEVMEDNGYGWCFAGRVNLPESESK